MNVVKGLGAAISPKKAKTSVSHSASGVCFGHILVCATTLEPRVHRQRPFSKERRRKSCSLDRAPKAIHCAASLHRQVENTFFQKLVKSIKLTRSRRHVPVAFIKLVNCTSVLLSGDFTSLMHFVELFQDY